jgi:hypothetical protein
MSYRRKEEIEDLLEEMKQIGVFNGTFDAKNGSWEFMHGVACVMEYLAYQVSEDYGEKFSEEFFKNMEKSIDKVKG